MDDISALPQQLSQASISQNSETPLEFPAAMPDTLSQLSLKYHLVFSIPMGISLARDCDHRINLQADSQPVKVKPYRYPCSQKYEIEIMVSHMLQEGLIEHSSSPYSSPVLLVKKNKWYLTILY